MFTLVTNLVRRATPPWLYDRLIGDWDKQGFLKYFKNTSWLFLGRIVTFIISFLTIAFVARYLGPENLGKLSYAQSFVAIFSMFASLGIDQIVYRELVAHPEREGEILGTAITTKFVFGVLTLLTTVTVAFTINTEPLLTFLIGLIALAFLFQPFGTVSHVFNARVLSKYPTYIAISIAVLVPLLKLLVIYFDQGIIYFAGIIAFEAFALSIAYIFIYRHVLHGSLRNFSATWITFTQLTRDSWPLMLVGATGYIYVRIDQVMIHHFIDSTSVGLYEAAVRLTDPLGFIPGTIIGSLFPAIVNAKQSDPAAYKKRLLALTALCISISSTLAIIIFVCAPFLIHYLYGSAFEDSIAILRIYVWSTVGTIAMALMYNYFIVENRTQIQLVFTFSGAVLNVGLNLILIPWLGITGAAYATLITVATMVGAFLVLRRRL